MKAIMMSIRPKHNCNIFNLIKLWEIRKKFPSDFVGWVYIYCTKKEELYQLANGKYANLKSLDIENGDTWQVANCLKDNLEGKVVARFWCDKVVEYVNGAKIVCGQPANFNTYKFILKETCLTDEELRNYAEDLSFKAIHITNLETFDKPKEIKDFNAYCERGMKCLHCKHYWTDDSAGYSIPMCSKTLTRAPQSWCYIEEEKQ